jgi:purine-binding chemotaxis protein CheW
MASDASATAGAPARYSDATANNADDPPGAAWLVCRAAARLYAVPIAHVIESMRVLPIEVLSGAPRYVRGLCIIRGTPVPVVDVGLLFGDQAGRCGRLVTLKAGSRTVALAVETVVGIREIGHEALSPLPPLLQDAAAETIAAIGTADAELLFVLRTARIVPAELFDRLDRHGATP